MKLFDKKGSSRIGWFIAVALMCCFLIVGTNAIAKRSGFKSKVFSSPKSTKRFKFKQTKNTNDRSNKPKIVKHKPSIGNRVVKKQKVVTPKPRSLAQQQKVATSRQAFKTQKQRFKKRKVATSNKSTNKVKPVIVNKTYNQWNVNARTSNSSTYYSRRGAYYNGWQQPLYVTNSYSSFGMWDSVGLWFMLDHMNDRRYRQMYYHHSSTSGMMEWRREADRLALSNVKLRRQLAEMDSANTTLSSQGVKHNSNYVPDGVDMDILMSSEMLSQNKPTLRFCTGPLDKNYYAIGKLLSKNIQSVHLTVISTEGTGENLSKLDKEQCDGAMVQRDGYAVHLNGNMESTLNYQRIFSPYKEVIHLICNLESGVEDLSDLNDDHTVMIGSKQSGSYVTWTNMVNENDDYRQVNTVAIGGALAKTKLISNQHDCLLTVSGLNTRFMMDIETLNRNNEDVNLELVEWNDDILDDIIDPDRKQIYKQIVLDDGTYPSIQIDNKFGVFNVDTNVATVPADIIINNNWISNNSVVFELLTSELINQSNQITRLVSTK